MTPPEYVPQSASVLFPLMAVFYSWRWGWGRAGAGAVARMAALPALLTVALPHVGTSARVVLGLAAIGALYATAQLAWPTLRDGLAQERWSAVELLAIWVPYMCVFIVANSFGVPGVVELILTGAGVVCLANVMPRLFAIILNDLFDG